MNSSERLANEFNSKLAEVLGKNLGLQDREESLVGQIALDVGSRIISGELLPGSDLNSVELAKRFDTSRTPVREALLLLEKQGLVEVPPRKRPRVADFDSIPIIDIYESRAVITGYMATKICRNWKGDDLNPLEARLNEMEEAVEKEDLDSFFWANMSLSEASAKLADNSVMTGFYDSLGLVSMLLRRRSLGSYSRIEESLHAHQDLFEAYKNRDTHLANAIAISLVRKGYRELDPSHESAWFWD